MHLFMALMYFFVILVLTLEKEEVLILNIIAQSVLVINFIMVVSSKNFIHELKIWQLVVVFIPIVSGIIAFILLGRTLESLPWIGVGLEFSLAFF